MNFKEGAFLKVFFVLFCGMFLSIGYVSASEDINVADHDNGICGVHDNKCGPVALQKSLETQGKTVTVSNLVEQSQTDNEGTTMHGMIKAAKQNGVNLYGVESEANKLQKDDMALLDADEGYHYTVIAGISEEAVTLHNPPQTMGLNEFTSMYTGYALTTKLNSQSRVLNSQELQTLKGSDWLSDAKNTVKQGINKINKEIGDFLTKKAERDFKRDQVFFRNEV